MRKSIEKGYNHDVYTEPDKKDFLTSKFLITLFHELKIPISSINGYLSLLLSGEIGKLSKSQFKVIKRTRDLSLYTVQLLNNLSSMSVLGNRRDVHHDKVSIQDLIERAISTLNVQVRSASLKIHTRLGSRPILIWAICVDLERILVNILSNAIKFTPKGGDIYISANKKGKHLYIKVRDTGIGIPKKALNKIFEDFYRADNVVRRYEGSGLGLSIVKRLVDYNRGKISIKSELNKGTYVDLALTMLSDKDVFNFDLEQRISEASRLGISFALLMVVGGNVAAIILDSLRKDDRSYVLGEGRYAVILPDVDYTEVNLICERLRSALQEKAFLEMAKKGRRLSSSVAVAFAVFPKDGATKEKLLSYVEGEIKNPSALIGLSKE